MSISLSDRRGAGADFMLELLSVFEDAEESNVNLFI